MIGGWWAAVQTAAVCLALLLGPGWVLARAWGARGLVALGAAPALCLAVIGPATFLAAALGMRWDRTVLLTGPVAWIWAAFLVLGLLVTRLGTRRRGKGCTSETWLDRSSLAPSERWRMGGAIALAGTLTALPTVLGTGGLESPAQASDAVFHLSATAFVRQGGNASFLGGLSQMYDGASVYYPTGWHALAALLPGDVVAGANVMVIVLAAVVWPLGAAALLREVVPETDGVLAAGCALAGSVLSPLLLLTSVWPYGMSVVLLPGTLALLARAARHGAVGALRRGGAWAVALAACLGVLMAHGAGLFNLAVLGLPLAAWAGTPVVERAWRHGGRGRLLMCGTAVLGALVVCTGAWVLRRPLVSVFSFPRGAASLGETVFGLLTDHPLLATFTPWFPGNLLLVLLALLGASTWKRAAWLRPWTVSTGVAVVILLLASGPRWPLRMLAGPWYTQRARIMPLVTIGLLVLATAGITEARRRWGTTGTADDGASLWRRGGYLARRHVPATLLIASLVLAPAWRWGLKEEVLAAVHDPSRASYGAVLGTEELAMVRRAPEKLPQGAVVVGDPSNGSAYLWSVAGVQVLYPSRPAPASGSDLRWVGEHLGQIETDPRVCQVLADRGVGYYYSDTATAGSGGRAPLWGQDWDVPASALERVDQGGTATLWRITACG